MKEPNNISKQALPLTLILHKGKHLAANVYTYAKFYIYKQKFPNGVIIGTTAKEIHAKQRLPFSKSTIKRHIELFKRHGLITEKDGRLYLISKGELAANLGRKANQTYIKLQRCETVKDMALQIRKALFETKIRQMQRAERKKRERRLPATIKNSECSHSKNGAQVKISLDSLCKVFLFESHSSSFRVVKDLHRANLIKRFVPAMTSVDFTNKVRPKRIIQTSRGYMYQPCSRYTL